MAAACATSHSEFSHSLYSYAAAIAGSKPRSLRSTAQTMRASLAASATTTMFFVRPDPTDRGPTGRGAAYLEPLMSRQHRACTMDQVRSQISGCRAWIFRAVAACLRLSPVGGDNPQPGGKVTAAPEAPRRRRPQQQARSR